MDSPAWAVVRRMGRNRNILIGGTVLLLLIAIALAAPLLAPRDPLAIDTSAALRPPDNVYWFGTDQFGRDLLSRVLHGSRISLGMGVISVVIAAAVGIPVGLIAGFYGRKVDMVLMRLIDLMLAFPGILLALVIVTVLGPGLQNAMLAVGIYGIPSYARLVRGSVLQAKELLYVDAARALGMTDLKIIVKHILPNILAPVIVLSTLHVAGSILTGASLSFLGLGAQPPTPEWGALVNAGRDWLRRAWWLSTFPGLAIMMTVVAINLVGDGLRDVLDPRLKG